MIDAIALAILAVMMGSPFLFLFWVWVAPESA